VGDPHRCPACGSNRCFHLCERCGARLHVYSTRLIGCVRIRYYSCPKCNWRPENNRETITLKWDRNASRNVPNQKTEPEPIGPKPQAGNELGGSGSSL
jgi:hypothetical protein